MIYQLQSTRDEEIALIFKRNLGVDKLNYSQLKWPLPNAEKISDRQMWHNFTIYSPRAWYNAGHVKINDRWASVVLIPMVGSEDKIYAIVKYHSGPGDEMEYYVFSRCKHEYEHSSGGNCYHIYICKHCKHRYDVDSSD